MTRGDVPFMLSGEPFCIMRERINLRGGTEGDWQWSLNTSPDRDGQTVISREEALKIITQFNMTLALNNTDGSIYDLPGRLFQQTFSHRYD